MVINWLRPRIMLTARVPKHQLAPLPVLSHNVSGGELGMLEYRKTMRAIATGFDTGEWPAPITTDYTDELNDFDLRRLEALRAQA